MTEETLQKAQWLSSAISEQKALIKKYEAADPSVQFQTEPGKTFIFYPDPNMAKKIKAMCLYQARTQLKKMEKEFNNLQSIPHMSKKVIYISGPITKVVGGNFKEFALAQEKLEALGYSVLNPHEICRFIDPAFYETPEAYWEACMRECLAKLPYAHIVVTLKDWEQSKGALKEVTIARETGFIEVHPIITFLSKHNDAN